MIRLRNLLLKDIDGMIEWMNDSELMKNFRFASPNVSKDQVRAFIENSQVDEKNKHFAIVGEDNEYLGTISLKNIDSISKNGEYAIALRHKAIGTNVAFDSTKLILNTAFEELGLEKVYLNVLSQNKRAIRFYEKVGFKKEGEFKRHLYVHAKFQSLSWYAIFKEDFI